MKIVKTIRSVLFYLIGAVIGIVVVYFIVGYVLIAAGVGFQYLGHRDGQFITFVSSANPPLDFAVYSIGNFEDFDKLGEVTINPEVDTDFSIVEGDIPLMRISTKNVKSASLTNYFDLINKDGSVVQVSNKDKQGKDSRYGYKDGKWISIPLENTMHPTAEESLQYDYVISALGLPKIANYKAVWGQARSFGFQQYYPWSLKFTINGVTHHVSFVTIKNPADLVIYPSGKIYR